MPIRTSLNNLRSCIGSVYAYTLIADQWTLQQKLLPTESTTTGAHFGESLFMQGDQLVVGAPQYGNAELGTYVGKQTHVEAPNSVFICMHRIFITFCDDFRWFDHLFFSINQEWCISILA
jgi:hypothetical protein